MKLKTTLAALMSLSASVACADGFRTGMQELIVNDAAGRNLTGYLWYPTEAKGEVEYPLGNAVWESIAVLPDAPMAEGRHPLVVLSHGMFGNARNQAWLAATLSEKGYIVAAVNHPGTSTFERDPDDRRQLWERPRDITRAIDHLIANQETGTQIDANRIFMAGHSLGGFTAVALAGGRFSPDKVDAMCDPVQDELICGIMSDWQVAKTPEDRAEMSADLSDDRIKAFAVFDLGATQTFSPESLAAIRAPLQVWGAPEDIHGMNLDIESRALIEAVAEGVADYLEPVGLSHFDFLGECTAKGQMILREEEPEDEFVCINGTDERRAEHEMIAQKVDAFFASH